MIILWLTMLATGAVTFAMRLSFILLLDKLEVPAQLQRALRFAPVAVLSAIIFPELLMANGSLELSPANPRLVAGLLAVLVAWRTKNVLLTISVGMVCLWALLTLLG